MFVMGFILFNPKNNLAPKVEIDEERVAIREDIFKSKKEIRWSELKQIDFKSFALDFIFNDNKRQLVILRTTAPTSLEIKKSIREMAEKKSIMVVSG